MVVGGKGGGGRGTCVWGKAIEGKGKERCTPSDCVVPSSITHSKTYNQYEEPYDQYEGTLPRLPEVVNATPRNSKHRRVTVYGIRTCRLSSS